MGVTLVSGDEIARLDADQVTLRELEFDMVFAGIDSSDGVGGIVPAAVAAHLGLPYLSYAARIEPDMDKRTVRVRRISATGYDLLEAPLPVVIGGTQALGEPRYPSLTGILAARNKEIVTRSLADLGLDASTVGGSVATTAILDNRLPPARAATEIVRGTPADGATRIVEFLAARRII